MHCIFAEDTFNHPDLYLMGPDFPGKSAWEPAVLETIPIHLASKHRQESKVKNRQFADVVKSIKMVSNYNRHFNIECKADTLYLENTYFDFLSSDFKSVKNLHIVNTGTPAYKSPSSKPTILDVIAPKFVILVYKITPEKFAGFPNLETLQITDTFSEFDDDFRELILKYCPKLKSIKINEN